MALKEVHSQKGVQKNQTGTQFGLNSKQNWDILLNCKHV